MILIEVGDENVVASALIALLRESLVNAFLERMKPSL